MISTGGKRLGAIAGGLALLGAVVYSMTARRAESQGQPSLSLRAEHVGRDLLITWDRSAVRKIQPRRANVTISDGDARKELLLDSSELESGKILYAPRSGELAIRLDMHVSGGTMSESIRVLEQVSEAPPPEPRPAEPPPAPAPQPVPAQLAASAQPKPQPPAPKPEPAAAPRRAFVAPASPRSAEQPKLSEPPLVAASRLDAPVPVPVGNVPVPPPAPPVAKPAAPASQIVQPAPLRRVQPVIPPAARPYMGLLTGPVIVDVETEIDATGAVTRAQVLRVTAEPAASRGGLGQHLAFSALTAARNWRFEPAKRNGVAVPGRSIVTFRFSPPQRPR